MSEKQTPIIDGDNRTARGIWTACWADMTINLPHDVAEKYLVKRVGNEWVPIAPQASEESR